VARNLAKRVQGSKDPKDALSRRSFSEKDPLFIGLFGLFIGPFGRKDL